MKLLLKSKRALLGIAAGSAAVSIALATGEMFQTKSDKISGAGEPLKIPAAETEARRGYELFMMNCAHCHGDDARGDEGPDLHGVAKSDARIAAMIKNGVKGEMPKFGAKLSDTEVKALIAFVRMLKD